MNTVCSLPGNELLRQQAGRFVARGGEPPARARDDAGCILRAVPRRN